MATMLRLFHWLIGLLALTLLGYGQIIDPTRKGPEDEGFFTGNPYEERLETLEEQVYEDSYEDGELREADLRELLYERGYVPRMHDENFETSLPYTHHEGQWSFRASPKIGDLFDDEYVRVPFGARYNFSDYFEMNLDLGAYFGNPFNDKDDAGLYSFRVGGKYTWLDFRNMGFNAALGLNTEMPIAGAPLEITDRFARFEPFLSLSHRLDRNPNWLLYLNSTYQIVDDSPLDTEPVDPQPRDRLFLRPGFIYYPGGHLRYGFEFEYRTNALHFRDKETVFPPIGVHSRMDNRILASEEVHEVIAYPGVTWFPTREFRNEMMLPGNWDVGVRFEIPLIEETGEDLGISVRFRWFYDYRKFVMEDFPDIFRQR